MHTGQIHDRILQLRRTQKRNTQVIAVRTFRVFTPVSYLLEMQGDRLPFQGWPVEVDKEHVHAVDA